MSAGKIVLAPNPYRDRGLAITKRARELLESSGHETVICPVYVELPEDSNMLRLESCAPDARLIVSFGGDGTFLHVARRVMGMPIPMLGVNMGTKGFMAALEPDELELICRAADGDFRRSKRMLLDVELLRDGEEPVCDCAMNEAVIKSDVSCIGLDVSADGVEMTRFSGDGVLVATPTGSTAYSMSAGGPIAEPEAEALLITPICAHAVAAKSFVLSPEREIIVKPRRLRGRRAILSVDGCEGMELKSGDEIRICRSKNYAIMADLGVRSFYDTVFNKLAREEPGE